MANFNDYTQQITLAHQSMNNSYAPYSNFHVGACLKTKDGRYFTGCNVENATYGATICAERTAFVKAISEGCKKGDFESIVIMGGTFENPIPNCTPCGICRQVMAEFCSPDFQIILAQSPENFTTHTLEELLPLSFAL